MATFVLCHGGWAGGWQWREVVVLLRASGHEVFTPTLTGLGERSHLANPEVNLDTHINDILGVFEYEELYDVILVGYSYSGMVITGVAELIAERIAHLVYFDAYVPRDGQSFIDILGSEMESYMKKAIKTHGNGWLMPYAFPDPPPKRTPQPINTGLQSISINNPAAAILPRTFIYCTDDKESMGLFGVPITHMAGEAKVDEDWGYHELNTGHEIPTETFLQEFVTLLLGLVGNET